MTRLISAVADIRVLTQSRVPTSERARSDVNLLLSACGRQSNRLRRHLAVGSPSGGGLIHRPIHSKSTIFWLCRFARYFFPAVGFSLSMRFTVRRSLPKRLQKCSHPRQQFPGYIEEQASETVREQAARAMR